MAIDTNIGTLKLCRDCRYQRDRYCLFFGGKLYTDIVTGEQGVDRQFCSTERENNRQDSCGPEAKYFEPKKKWWKLW